MKVGLISHDSKKKLMQNFCIAYRGILARHELYATGTTGNLVQVASQIEQGNLDMIIFLRDPNSGMDERSDLSSILSLCDMYNIPIGTNLATAELLIHALERGELEWRNIG